MQRKPVNAHILTHCSNTILWRLLMFQISCVRHQEDHLYMQFCMVCFSYIYVIRLVGGRMCSILPSLYTADYHTNCVYKWNS